MHPQTSLAILCLVGLALAGQAPSKPAPAKPAAPAPPAKSQLVVDGVQFAVFERTAKPTLATIKGGSKDSKVHSADKTNKIQLKFTVKDSKTNAATIVQQAFVALVNAESEQEVIFVAEPETASKVYTAEIDLKTQEKNFDGVNGVYQIRVFVGDSKAANAIDWNVADVKLTLTPVEKPAPKKSQVVNYETLPVIEHQFREPEKRPSQFISDTFTVICAAPLLLLLVLWLSIGINFGNLPISLWTLAFHAGLIAIFGLYFTFWVQLNMFDTLKYLAIIGVPTFVSGNRLLRSLNEARRLNKE
uniref:Dolichyl-diphosphooligosaccharide--protein glycosyltransferase subunit 2 n=1 Tax=Panagrellus redivivus TaxID=6233 RepID=A0A7E4VHH0_PANRE